MTLGAAWVAAPVVEASARGEPLVMLTRASMVSVGVSGRFQRGWIERRRGGGHDLDLAVVVQQHAVEGSERIAADLPAAVIDDDRVGTLARGLEDGLVLVADRVKLERGAGGDVEVKRVGAGQDTAQAVVGENKEVDGAAQVLFVGRLQGDREDDGAVAQRRFQPQVMVAGGQQRAVDAGGACRAGGLRR